MSEQQPTDKAAYVEHPDLEEAVEVDDHGPAFVPPPEPEEPDE